MDSIEKLLKTGRPAKEYQKSKGSLVMSDDNKPIFIDPKKYPSPHMIIYEPIKGMKNGKWLGLEYEIKGSHTTEELIAKKAAALGKGMVVRFICSSADYPFISKAVGEDYTLKRGSAVADFLRDFGADVETEAQHSTHVWKSRKS